MSRLYKKIISTVDPLVPKALLPLWNHPIGPKTIFFWAPLGKCTLVAAGLGDLNRPPATISVRQSASLAVTAVIWARWCTIIIPKNYPLCLINVFVAGTSFYQLSRYYMYQKELEAKEKAKGK
ncbi:hypothetical protein HW555_009402 [Spodoptera exigua]|uniref:Mitochondrial pyruvate carrier n=1 Tax=Spodoptera exigua TaxID=7107 RepID=A0A835GD38_SPOEX|nr:hypothetical protein HW555_009402 [Spodoptera exigua]KAH9642721.1 hypothetical protein HF086_002991 [Spodoptera exigua]